MLNNSIQHVTPDCQEKFSFPSELDKAFYLACGTQYTLRELALHKISHVICNYTQPLLVFSDVRRNATTVGKPVNITSFLDASDRDGVPYDIPRLSKLVTKATGVQVFTGGETHTEHNGERWYLKDIDIEIACKKTHPQLVADIENHYSEHVIGTPLITQTKSKGVRLSAYTNAEPTIIKQYVSIEDGNETNMLELFSANRMSRYNRLYKHISGNLYNIPRLDDSHIRHYESLCQQAGLQHKYQTSLAQPVSPAEIGITCGTDEDIHFAGEVVRWDGKRRSQLFHTEHCRNEHTSNRKELRLFLKDGKLMSHCYNCGEVLIIFTQTPPPPDYIETLPLDDPIFTQAPPPEHPPYAVRRTQLFQNVDTSLGTKTIEEQRESIADIPRGGYVAIKAEPGLGKTETLLREIVKRGCKALITVPTALLRDEVVARAKALGIKVYGWVGISSNPEAEFPIKPCIMPDRYIAISNSGRNPVKMLCMKCPKRKQCEKEGHRSQEKKARNADLVVIAQPDLPFNPAHSSFAGFMIPSGNDNLVIIDEFNVDSFIEITVDQQRLEQLKKDNEGNALGAIMKAVMMALIIDNNPGALWDIVGELTEEQIEEIHTQLSRVVYDGYPYSETEEYEVRPEVRDIHEKPLEDIRSLKKIEKPRWNLLVQLQAFTQHYTNPKMAPVVWYNEKLTFYLPPTPFKTDATYVFLSATLNTKAFKNLFERHGTVHIIEATGTEWHSGARVYQLETNKNSRRTMRKRERKEGNGNHFEDQGSSETGKEYVSHPLKFADNNPQYKHGYSGFKETIEEFKTEFDASGFITANYGATVGLDEQYKDVDVQHVQGAPHSKPEVIELLVKKLSTADDTEFSFEYDKNKKRYKDDRVQELAERVVTYEMVQAVGRARLMLYDKIVIVYSSVFLPGITNHPNTRLIHDSDFYESNWQLDKIDAVIDAREQRIALLDDVANTGDAKQMASAKGVGMRQARMLTKPHRDTKKDERNSRILESHASGTKVADIAKQLGVPRSTIYDVLKRQNKSVGNGARPRG